MNSYDLMLSDEERSYISEIYPNVDLDDLGMPVMGLTNVTSLEYLDVCLKFDIETNDFRGKFDPEIARVMSKTIRKKIKHCKENERRIGISEELGKSDSSTDTIRKTVNA